MASAICMWFLRAWKIGQIETTTTELEKSPEEVDVISHEPQEITLATTSRTAIVRSSVVKRLFAWKRV